MPRLPVDGTKVIEYRITMGSKERMLLESLTNSVRMKAFVGEEGVVDAVGDFSKLLAFAASIGGILELLGITDFFDFDDEIKAKVMEIIEKNKDNAKDEAYDIAVAGYRTQLDILFPGLGDILTGNFPDGIPGESPLDSDVDFSSSSQPAFSSIEEYQDWLRSRS